MISRLSVQSFRSIDEVEVEFGPITVLYGPTSSGKSTLLYSLLVLRNFTINPNQSTDGLFNLGFLNLGGFDACLFNHEPRRAISMSAEFTTNSIKGSYGINLRKTEVEITSEAQMVKMTGTASMPYGANQSWSQTSSVDEKEYTINWNGFAFSVTPISEDRDGQAKARKLAEELNFPAESLKRIDIAPHRRGFFKPSYTPVPLTPTPTSEDEVATLIINDQNAQSRISIDTVNIFDRDFRLYLPPGTATTYLKTTEQSGAKVPGDLVNDGFGVNQVVYMLAKIHRPETETILIEEPEVHLHPTVIRKFARVIANLAVDEGRQLVFTTHSAQFLLSLLSCVKEGILQPDQLCCYHVDRNRKKSVFTREPVSKDGQISGGLASFTEGELEDIKTFLSPNR